jgi:L-aspartate oxidase
MKEDQYDVLVIGSGAAGLGLALSLANQYSVAVVCKDGLLTSSSQRAQGGIAAVMNQEDSLSSHIEDTLIAGANLCDPTVVEFTVNHAKEAILWLSEQGVEFTAEKNHYHLTQEGGHSYRRIVHAADKTGAAVVKTLSEQVNDHPNIHSITEHTAIDLLVQDKHCYGASFFDNQTQTVKTLHAKFTVLACGGASMTYQYTSNKSHTTGDGIAMAFRSGARVADMEFNQFHPTSFFKPDGKTFLITEVMRGEGAILKLPNGERFMKKYDSRVELAPRDIVARAIDGELKKNNLQHVYLDVSHENAEKIKKLFPTIYQLCLKEGVDITKEAIPVVPAAHYTCGGIVTDLKGQTDIENLFAIGETACTGLHGANRLASNSLLECLVFAKSAAQEIQNGLKHAQFANQNFQSPKEKNYNDLEKISALTEQLRELVWQHAGIVRSTKDLKIGEKKLGVIEKAFNALWESHSMNKPLIELRNLIQNAKLIIASALSRHESRGVHFNRDYPNTLETTQHTIATQKNNHDIQISKATAICLLLI